jgi:hypothetical protein
LSALFSRGDKNHRLEDLHILFLKEQKGHNKYAALLLPSCGRADAIFNNFYQGLCMQDESTMRKIDIGIHVYYVTYVNIDL